MKLQRLTTSKLFYKKWAYKIECRCAGSYMIKRSGVSTTLAFCLGNGGGQYLSYINKDRLRDFLNDVEQFLDRKDLHIRTEGQRFNIFCSDINLFNSICKQLSHWITSIHQPANEIERQCLEDSKIDTVLCNKLPYDTYKYRVFLRTNIPLNIKLSFAKWCQNYYPKMLVSPTVEKWLYGTVSYTTGPYIYVDAASNLSMVGLFLGQGVLRVEEFIPRSSININTDQEQPCPV